MIAFNFIDVQFDFDKVSITKWLEKVIESEGKSKGQISYIFCNDKFLLDVNQRFLNHDTYTDIITFDNSIGNSIGADIYISSERVADNATNFGTDFSVELLRVIVHGVLHLCGYKDKTETEAKAMRDKEDEKIAMFHVGR